MAFGIKMLVKIGLGMQLLLTLLVIYAVQLAKGKKPADIVQLSGIAYIAEILAVLALMLPSMR